MANINTLVLIGIGNIGLPVLEQLSLQEHNYSRIVMADSTHVVSATPIQKNLSQVLTAKKEGRRLDTLEGLEVEGIENLANYFGREAVVINATPTQFTTEGMHYSVAYDFEALERGSSVVTAHKTAFGGEHYNKLVETAAKNSAWYIPTGAIMAPTRVVEILLFLRNEGIRIKSARGIVNGTDNYILSEMHNDKPKDEALREEIDRGVAEPDPRDDLNGKDPYAKMKGLAMICDNYCHSQGEVFGISDPRSGLPEVIRRRLDNNYKGIEGVTDELIAEIKARGVLKLVGSYDSRRGIVQVGPQILDRSNPLSSVQGTQNMLILQLDDASIDPIKMLIQIYTSITHHRNESEVKVRYRRSLDGSVIPQTHSIYTIKFSYHQPRELIIAGPGAGNAETAAALLLAAQKIKDN